MKRFVILVASILLCAFAVKAQQQPSFVFSRTISLPGITGKFDHLAFDQAGNRLFLAATANHSVEIVDLKTDTIQQTISGLGKPHGLVWVGSTGSLYVADGAMGELLVYKGAPLALTGKIKLSDDADDMVYDEAHHLLFVGHGGSDAANPARIAVVDTDHFTLVRNLPVASHPEALEIDPQTRRVFANIAGSGEVVVIDTVSKAISQHWKLTKAADNVPLAFDGEHQLLYLACRTPGTVIALDATSGREVASQPSAGGADDLFYDSALRRVYLISGAGEVDEYQVSNNKSLLPLGVLHTAAGAKTALFVPAQNLLYVAVPGIGANPDEIRVYSTAPEQVPTIPAKIAAGQEELKFVVIVSRHGVRSPTGKTDQLNQYSAEPWPAWSVPPGYLTEHGARLMTLFGAYDRELLSSQGLLAKSGCGDAERIRIVADSDQRTRETGKALASGLAPGCAIEVTALPEGTADPLFHSLSAGVGNPDKALATAAISGRIGGNLQGLSEACRPQLEALEEVLRGCTPKLDCEGKPAPRSLFDIPSSIAPGKGDHLVDLRTPLGIASTMAENMLLEYTEGMDAAKVGWGRVDIHKLRELLQLHTAEEDITQRPDYIARAQSSNLLFHILQSMEQAQNTQSIGGALSKPGDRLLILVGHDTNLANISGALGLNWLIDGRRDDTPPGGALVFELWKDRDTSKFAVRTYYTAQTLEQMRSLTPISLDHPPERVAVFVPGCSQADSTCSWGAFQQAVQSGIDSAFVR
jgi:4-phytase/acid phosphatase